MHAAMQRTECRPVKRHDAALALQGECLHGVAPRKHAATKAVDQHHPAARLEAST